PAGTGAITGDDAADGVDSAATAPAPSGANTADYHTPAPPPVRARPAAPRRVGAYEILGELGRGAMGVVYRARHVQLNRPAAVKMILAGDHAGASARARFLTEAEAVARLQHPHIVQIYEIGDENGRPSFALAYVE